MTTMHETGTKRTRRFKKRALFKRVPKMPVPVKALWAGAGEKKRAHATCVVMLEHWLGRIPKAEAAEKLQVTPLRVWQLSQQALAGMVAGLLKQPKGRGPAAALDPDEPRVLKGRLLQLEREAQAKDALIALLKDLPAHREETQGRGAGRPHATRGRKPTMDPRKDPGTGRSPAPGAESEARG